MADCPGWQPARRAGGRGGWLTSGRDYFAAALAAVERDLADKLRRLRPRRATCANTCSSG